MRVAAVLLSLVLVGLAAAQTTSTTTVYPEPDFGRPQYLVPYVDELYGSYVMRISNKNAAPAVTTALGGAITWGSDARHHYSTDNPWSRNGTYYWIQNSAGGAHCSNSSATGCTLDAQCQTPPGGTCVIPPACTGTCKPLILDGNSFKPLSSFCTTILDSTGTSTALADNDSWWSLQSGDEARRIALQASTGKVFNYSTLDCKLKAAGSGSTWQSGFTAIALGDSEAQSWDGQLAVVIDTVAPNDHRRIQIVETINGGRLSNIFDVFTLPSAVGTAVCGSSSGCKITQAQVSVSGNFITVNYSGDFTRVLDFNRSTFTISNHAYSGATPVFSGCLGYGGTTALASGFIFDLSHRSNGKNPYDSNADVVVGENHCGNSGTSQSGVNNIGRVVMVKLSDASVTSLTQSYDNRCILAPETTCTFNGSCTSTVDATCAAPETCRCGMCGGNNCTPGVTNCGVTNPGGLPMVCSNIGLEAFATHISMLSYDAPGWATVTYSDGASGKKFNQEVVAISLDVGHEIRRYTRTHSDGTGYYRCESHGVPSPDGRKIAFASCWVYNCGTICTGNSPTCDTSACGDSNLTNPQDYVVFKKVAESGAQPAAVKIALPGTIQ